MGAGIREKGESDVAIPADGALFYASRLEV